MRLQSGDWTPSPAAEQDLLLAFNRGFTRGYLLGDRHGTLMARDAPDNRGICIGTRSKAGRPERDRDRTSERDAGTGNRRRAAFYGSGKGSGGLGISAQQYPARNWCRRPLRSVSHGPLHRAHRSLSPPPATWRQGPGRSLHIPLPIWCAGSPWISGYRSMTGGISAWKAGWNPGREKMSGYRTSRISVLCRHGPARSRATSWKHRSARAGIPRLSSGIVPSPMMARSLHRWVNSTACAGSSFPGQRMRSLHPPSPQKKNVHGHASGWLRIPAPILQLQPLPGKTAVTTTPPAITVYADTPEAVSMAVKEGCTSICFEPAFVLPRHSCQEVTEEEFRSIRQQVTEAMALCRDAGVRFVLKLPRITRDDYLGAVLPEISRLHADGLAACMVENPGAAYAVHTLMYPIWPCMVRPGLASSTTARPATSPRPSSPSRSRRNCPGTNARNLVRAARRDGCSASFALIVQGISEAMITEDCLLEPVQHCRAGGDNGSGQCLLRYPGYNRAHLPVHDGWGMPDPHR